MLKAVRIGRGGPHLDDITELNRLSFAPQESTPVGGMLDGADTGMADVLAFEDSGRFVGYSYVVCHDGFLYIYYLAVRPELRSTGYGSRMLSAIEARYPHDYVALHMEVPDGTEAKERRLRFYLRNGFTESKVPEDWHGMRFELMYAGEKPSPERCKAFFSAFDEARKNIKHRSRPGKP